MTKLPQRDVLRQSMNEVAALQDDDARRLDIERQLVDAEPWAKAEWQLLLDETALLREHVPGTCCDVELPAEMEERLWAIARSASTPASPMRRRVVWGSLATVAGVLLVVFGIVAVRSSQRDERMQAIALLAINNHVKHVDEESDFKPAMGTDLERELSELLNFAVVIPELGREFRMVGGRKCKLGEHPVAYTLWHGPSAKLSLFQCEASRLKLPEQMEPRLVHPREHPVADSSGQALIWSENSHVYVLVGESDIDLQRVSQNRKEYP